jgi:hypothetical protein
MPVPRVADTRQSGQRGVALAVVLVTIVLVLIISATLVAIAVNEYQVAGASEASEQAFRLAESGIEIGIARLRLDPDWSDTNGATGGRSPNPPWFFLLDGGDFDRRAFPPGSTSSTITVELCRYSQGQACGVPNATADPLCNDVDCIWIRATGRVPGASRRIEALLGRFNPGTDLINFSNTAINLGAGGGGNGTFRLHGSLYVAKCTMQQGVCVGLQMQGDGQILNDRPHPTVDEGCTPPTVPCDLPPYNNRVYVNGAITGQGNSWTIGLSTQPMMAVHATGGWLPAYDNQIHGFSTGTSVPALEYPDPSRACQDGVSADQQRCLINRLYLPNTDPGRLVPANALKAYVCLSPSGCSQWREIELDEPNETLYFCSSGCPTPGWTWRANPNQPTRTRIVIPARNASGDPAVDCRTDATTCNNASGANGQFSVVFNGFASTGTNLFVTRNAFIHAKTRLVFDGDVRYDGFATVLVENTGNLPTPAIEIRGSFTPLCPASQSLADPTWCPDTAFARGNTLAFAVGPGCESNVFSDNCPGPANEGRGSVYIRGSTTEVNLVIVAHGTVKNDVAGQRWYGLFIAHLLDWDNNPEIFPVPELRYPGRMPPGFQSFFRGSSGVAVYRWWEPGVFE